jgi:hypothetical protein
MSAGRPLGVRRTALPASAASRSHARGTGHRHRDRGARAPRLVAKERQEGPVVGHRPAPVVHQPRGLASGLEEDPEVGAGVAHLLGQPGSQPLEIGGDEHRPMLVRERVHRQCVAAEAAHDRGRDQGAGPEGVIHHDLELCSSDGVEIDGPEQPRDVLLGRVGRKLELAEARRGDVAIVLPEEDALDLTLSRGGQVGAVGIEETDLHDLGVLGGRPDADASRGLATRDREARDRQRGELEVVTVHSGGVQPGDQGPLHRARGPAGVSPADHDAPPFQRRPVGHPESHGDHRGDPDVDEARDAARPEQAPGRDPLPHDALGNNRPRLHRPRRISLYFRF